MSKSSNKSNTYPSINDINELILEYCDIFDNFDDYGILATLDGTLNYVLSLLIEHAKVAYESV